MLNKRNPNQHLDEMQVQTRNIVGHQCFFILYFLLMIDLFLKDHGLKWAMSSMSVLVIMLLCAGYYGIRIAWAGAYEGPLTKIKKHIMVGLIAAMTIIIVSLLIIIRTNIFKESFNISYSGVLRFSIFCLVFIMIIVVSVIFTAFNYMSPLIFALSLSLNSY